MAEITYRLLNPDEYSRLADHPMLKEVKLPEPEHSRIVVAEVDGEIVGFQFLFAVIHMEPIWVDEKYRSTLMASRLFKEAVKSLADFRTNVAYCFGQGKISSYLTRLGLRKLPYDTFLYDPNNEYPQ